MLQGWEKLTSPERETILRGLRDNAVYGGPYHVEFSPTDACNYDCFFCNTAFVDRSKRLPWDLMRQTLLTLIEMGLKSVRLSGGGEPLIYPEIDRFFDLCLEHRIDISNVTTNGFNLTPKIVDQLLRLDTSEIIVSFNDVDPASYASTNGTTERAFERVLENVSYLMEERKARGLSRPNVIQQFMLWKGNYDRIDRAYDLALSLGVDQIYIRDMWGITPERRMSPQQLMEAGRSVRRLMERDKEAGLLLLDFKNEKILPEYHTFAEQETEKSGKGSIWSAEDAARREYCYVGWYSTVIWGSGQVFPCCMLAGSEGYPPLGNIKENSIREIWEGANYAKLRDELREIAISGGRWKEGENHCFARKCCSMRFACPVVAGLASPAFYDEAYGVVEALRKRPATALRRVADVLTSHRPFIGAAR